MPQRKKFLITLEFAVDHCGTEIEAHFLLGGTRAAGCLAWLAGNPLVVMLRTFKRCGTCMKLEKAIVSERRADLQGVGHGHAIGIFRHCSENEAAST